MGERFTASRVPRSGIPELIDIRERWQGWMDLEAALAHVGQALDC